MVTGGSDGLDRGLALATGVAEGEAGDWVGGSVETLGVGCGVAPGRLSSLGVGEASLGTAAEVVAIGVPPGVADGVAGGVTGVAVGSRAPVGVGWGAGPAAFGAKRAHGAR